jgi:hypothetical protein
MTFVNGREEFFFGSMDLVVRKSPSNETAAGMIPGGRFV